jgi:glucose-1-phosphate cytidylyltransferase
MAAMTPISGMEAIILCGGLGMRLREETEFKPKPMALIGDRPILWHIMSLYHTHGVRNFILCLGYKGDVIRDYFLNFRYYNGDVRVDLSDGTVSILSRQTTDWRVTLVETGSAASTGARIRSALPYISGERLFVTYGDGVSDVDISALLEFHVSQGKLSTVTAVRPPSRFGELLIDGNMARSFREKPQTTEGWINGGFFVFETKVIRELSDNADLVLESTVLQELSARNELAVFQHRGFWQCMDTYRELQLLNTMWAEGNARWKVW